MVSAWIHDAPRSRSHPARKRPTSLRTGVIYGRSVLPTPGSTWRGGHDVSGLARVQCARAHRIPAPGVRRAMGRVFASCGAVILVALCLVATMPPSSSGGAPEAAVAPSAIVSHGLLALNFRETGLLNGTIWEITLDGQQGVAAAPAEISFSVPPGKYAYAIGEVDGAVIRTIPEPVNVSGEPQTVSVVFAPAIQHVVVIVYENAELSQLWRFPGAASYFLTLSAKYGNATNFYAACHPSIKD